MRVRDASLVLLGGLLGGLLGAAACYLLLADRPLNDSQLLAQLERQSGFIADHPELVEQTRAALRARALASRGNERARLISGKWGWATDSTFAATLGNPQAPYTLVEFTDYTCIPCRQSAAAIEATVQQNRDVRVALFFVPTGGPTAEYAARVAYAAYRQNPQLFPRLHLQLMHAANGEFTAEIILAAARSGGYDIEQIERDLSTSENRRYIDTSREFAGELQVSGVPAFAAGAALVMGEVGQARLSELVSAARVPPPPQSFRLRDQNGRVTTAETFRGSWVALMFGFTHCPDVCPTTLLRLSTAVRKLGPGGRVRLAFVTVDPERDTQADLSKYVAAFGGNITALTGSAGEITETVRAFGAYAAKQPPAEDGSYSVDHSSLIYVLDPSGRLSRQVSSGTPVDNLVSIFRSLP